MKNTHYQPANAMLHSCHCELPGENEEIAPILVEHKDKGIDRQHSSGKIKTILLFMKEQPPRVNIFEFHVSRRARQKYGFDEALFSTDGRVIVADFSAARRFAESMSLVRSVPVPASEINAMGLIDEIMHIVIRQYELQNPGVMMHAVQKTEARMGKTEFDSTQVKFLEEFPPVAVYQKKMTERDYLSGQTEGRLHRETTLEEMLLLQITNLNPAVQPYKELFDEESLKRASAYEVLVGSLSDFFNGETGFGGKGSAETLIHVLRAPALASPYSLSGQLEFLLNKWGAILGDAFVQRILRGMDFVKEEAIRSTGPGGFSGRIGCRAVW
jgi:hypothetical protein